MSNHLQKLYLKLSCGHQGACSGCSCEGKAVRRRASYESLKRAAPWYKQWEPCELSFLQCCQVKILEQGQASCGSATGCLS